MFKRDPANNDILPAPGEEYYNNSIPFEGVFINYADSIKENSGGDIADIKYTHRSRISGELHPTSSYTAAVQDVKDGIVDMSVGNFWITAERLKMTTFTVPLFNDRTVLVVPQPGTDNSFHLQLQKAIRPFTPELWGLIIATVFFASLFGVWFTDRAPTNDLRRGKARRSKSAYLRLAIDSCLQKGMFFCSAGVEQDSGATLSGKLLTAGYGVIILTRHVDLFCRPPERRVFVRSHLRRVFSCRRLCSPFPA